MPPPDLDRLLDEAMDDSGPMAATLAVLVVHRGDVVAERYAPGVDAGTTLISWSMAKSILHAAVGILVGMDRLARFIGDHHVRDAAGKAVRIRPGYYVRSAFYLATGRYHALTYNSNSWAASALRAAGAPMDPSAVSAGGVMRQAAAIAARQAHPRGADR